MCQSMGVVCYTTKGWQPSKEEMQVYHTIEAENNLARKIDENNLLHMTGGPRDILTLLSRLTSRFNKFENTPTDVQGVTVRAPPRGVVNDF